MATTPVHCDALMNCFSILYYCQHSLLDIVSKILGLVVSTPSTGTSQGSKGEYSIMVTHGHIHIQRSSGQNRANAHAIQARVR